MRTASLEEEQMGHGHNQMCFIVPTCISNSMGVLLAMTSVFESSRIPPNPIPLMMYVSAKQVTPSP